jgi:pyridoxal phosphate enzyme (YggS family)
MLLRAGITLIGENRVQDAFAKLGANEDGSKKDIREDFPGCRIHMIGHLQTNKINQALKLFDSIETVDRIPLAEALEKRLDKILPILVEVKLTSEDTKTGCPHDELNALLEYIRRDCPHLELSGLMGMGPFDENPETARPFYRRLRDLFDRCRDTSPDPDTFRVVSMGMSADFHVAIQEGATLVRIGRALFDRFTP